MSGHVRRNTQNCGAGPNSANALCGTGRLGVDLIQLIVAPTLSYKINEQHSIGIAPLIGFQRFRAQGLQAFDNAPGFPPFTSAKGSVTNNGYSNSVGYGVRVGYYGRLSDLITVGASYASKMKMGKFSAYRGLFAEQGGFDIPENFTLGIAVHPKKDLTIAMDVQRISYGKIASIGNSSAAQALLGSNSGPGFGWSNINVYKLGVEYDYSEKLKIRAGLNHGDNPIKSSDVTLNILAPGVVQDHVSMGFSYMLANQAGLNFSYMHAMKKSVNGSSLFNNFGPGVGGTEKIYLKQDAIGVSYSSVF